MRFQKGVVPSTAFKKGHITWNKGKKSPFSKEALEKMKISHLGQIAWNKGKTLATDFRITQPWLGKKRPEQSKQQTGRKFSDETKKRLRESHLGKKQSAEQIEKRASKMRGKDHPTWRGGVATAGVRAVIAAGKRRAYKLGNGGSYTLEEWESLKERFNYMCLCCKRLEPEIKLSVDHINPLSKGGRNDIQNIQPLCRSCNSRKHARNIDYISAYFTL